MSIKNKATDRDRHGRMIRKYTGPGAHSHGQSTPGWWVSLHMTRPRRRANKALCQKLLRGDIGCEEVVFPLGNHKPHEYYW